LSIIDEYREGGGCRERKRERDGDREEDRREIISLYLALSTHSNENAFLAFQSRKEAKVPFPEEN
jgi:hypothetical protein